MPSTLRKSASADQIHCCWHPVKFYRQHSRVRALLALHSGFASKAHYSITDGHAYREVIFEGNNIYSGASWNV